MQHDIMEQPLTSSEATHPPNLRAALGASAFALGEPVIITAGTVSGQTKKSGPGIIWDGGHVKLHLKKDPPLATEHGY